MSRRLAARIRNFVTNRRGDTRLREEMEAHLAMQTEENLRAGMSPEGARRQARLQLGSTESIREQYHAEEGLPFVERLVQDTRFAWRILRKSPAFTLLAVFTLAVGIGANTAIFSLIDALFLKPLPLPHAEQLVRIYARGPTGHYGAGFSMPEFENLREHTASFSALAAEDRIAQLDLVTSDGSAEVSGAFVSGNYFDLVGVEPRLGRSFLPAEDAVPNRNAVAVISDDLWRVALHSDPAVLGRPIQINGVKFIVIGIAPPGFRGDLVGSPEEVWMPAMMLGKAGYACGDGSYNCSLIDAIVGRLAPGILAARGQAEVSSAVAWSAADWPERPSRRQAVLFPAGAAWPDSQADDRGQMHLLMAITGSLLLVACANLAGLLLARGAGRKTELAVRLAIGARRSRIVRQLFTESMLLSAVGGALGVLVSFAIKNLLSRFYEFDSEGFHHLYNLSFDWRVLLYAVALTFITGVFFGMIPALRASRLDLATDLKQGTPTARPAASGLRHALVIGQVALSMVLVISTGLLVRSSIAVQRGTNFDPAHVVVLRMRPELLKYTPQQVQSLVVQSVRRISGYPLVQSVAFMQGGEGLLWNWQNGRDAQVSLPGAETNLPHAGFSVLKQDISANFFHTLHTPLLQGREFNNGDRAYSPRVAIVNGALALRFWRDGKGVGRTLMVNGLPYQVVGIAANLQPGNALQRPEPHLYLSYWQSGATREGDVRLAIRVAGDPASSIGAIRRVIQSIDPAVPIGEDMPMSEQIGLEYMPVLLARSVMSWCGLLALCLGAIGLYSVLAFAVRSRTREIGIRMALGARREDVMRMIVRQGVRLTLAGVSLGVAAAVVLTRLEASLLYGVRATDPVIYGGVAVLLFVCALAACFLPARRAARINPMEALRSE
ncbi:MAG TPA: ABC transporter permease [Acidobacteriaceae bacterium]|nr:ABC transporter permease [Acidobacteriaceae bacterium]